MLLDDVNDVMTAARITEKNKRLAITLIIENVCNSQQFSKWAHTHPIRQLSTTCVICHFVALIECHCFDWMLSHPTQQRLQTSPSVNSYMPTCYESQDCHLLSYLSGRSVGSTSLRYAYTSYFSPRWLVRYPPKGFTLKVWLHF